jgi:hypothetical protein
MMMSFISGFVLLICLNNVIYVCCCTILVACLVTHWRGGIYKRHLAIPPIPRADDDELVLAYLRSSRWRQDLLRNYVTARYLGRFLLGGFAYVGIRGLAILACHKFFDVIYNQYMNSVIKHPLIKR